MKIKVKGKEEKEESRDCEITLTASEAMSLATDIYRLQQSAMVSTSLGDRLRESLEEAGYKSYE